MTSRVYVGNLSWTVTSDQLKAAMAKAGTVVSAEVVIYEGRSAGWGTCEFDSADAASAAIEKLNSSDLAGRRIHAREDKEGGPTSVYVGNLAWTTTSADLKAAAGAKSAEVRMLDGRSAGYGLVEYNSADAASAAIAQLNDTELEGRPMFMREDREDPDVPKSAKPARASRGAAASKGPCPCVVDGVEKRKDHDGARYSKDEFRAEYNGFREWDQREERMDRSSGDWYTKAEFKEHYGGYSEWDRALTVAEHLGKGKGGKKGGKGRGGGRGGKGY